MALNTASAMRWMRRWFGLLWLGWLVAGASLAAAQGAAPRNFDHLKTGYALTGAHVQIRCEACHQNGLFKGTPRECASCHVSGMRFARGNVVKPQQHVPTQLGCDACHTTQTYLGAKFNHVGTLPGTCQSCHTGTLASSKPTTHIQTSASCDTCHRTNAWVPAASFDHAGVSAGTCTTCHGAGRAGGKPANHVPYQSVSASASANCDTCHKGSFSSWANGRFHANVSVSGSCATCHTGGFLNAVGKPNTPVHTGVTACESCHNTGGWAGAKVDHSGFNASTNCTNCHNGTTATAKPAAHIPVGATSCFSCHNVSPAGWKPTRWTHTQIVVAAQCASCHSGGYPPADGRPTNHIPYQTVAVSAAANCDACHKGSFTTWANGRFHSSYSVSTGCFSCHTGAYLNAVGKPNTATHASVTGNCESCHKSTATWSSAKVDHSTYTAATNCSQCHGVSATGKPATHIPTTANCFACHNVSPQLWTPTKWNHTQVVVTAACASCHTGGYPPADGRPGNHIPYQTVPVTAAANCDACHKGSFTTWANGRLHSYYSVSTGCFSCHTGAYLNAVGKPNTATHASVAGNCESCHKSTTSWLTVTFAHSAANAVGTGTCDTCHNGSTAKGKDATHIPIPAGAARCDSCHRSQASFLTSVTMNHSVVTTAQCKTCHNGSYTSKGSQGALAKPANHIPEVQLLNGAAMDCSACHASTTSWGTMTMNHNNSQGNGAGWCKGCHTSGQGFLGSMEKKSLTHQKSTGVTDCSQSGCHRPLGNRGTPYRSW